MTDTRDSLVYCMLFVTVCAIVLHPEDVSITVEPGVAGTEFSVTVHPADLGALIGREGTVVRAVRTILSGVSTKLGRRFSLVIVNPSRAEARTPAHVRLG